VNMEGKLFIPYNPKLKSRAAWLRKNTTLAEMLLWYKLRGKQLFNIDFHRQKPILNYIVDFYSPDLKLVIEIDGFSHNFKYDYDVKREDDLKKLGLNVIRFQESGIIKDVDNAIQVIVDYINNHKALTHP
jgi:very-short-patch-repair endonuclease